MTYHHTPIRMANIKKIDYSYANKNAEELQLSYTANGSVKWYNHVGNQLGNYL